jgi:uncharacterized protein (DUF1015 family)
MDTQNMGVGIPEILLPSLNTNMKKWAVIACDQFTSQPDYWMQVERTVGNAPSILHMILPEVYLNYEGLTDNIKNIDHVMHDYIEKGILEQLPRGIMLVERIMEGTVRKGLIMMVDLECYDYIAQNKPLIRATEKTLLERIPPRVTIRQEAPLETSHVMAMMDDPRDSVIGPVYKIKDELEKLYDFDLMLGGGRIRGYFVENEDVLNEVLRAMSKLPLRDGMRYCVGDGNHSLAAAKTVWDLAKENMSEEERENHPLRFAMCEFVNIHDDGIEFMPIHRVIFKVSPIAVLEFIVERLNKRGAKAKLMFGRWRGGQEALKGNELPFLYRDGAGKIVLEHTSRPLLLEEVQDILDDFMSQNQSSTIDYIHGQDVFENLAKSYDNLGLYFSPIPKDKFFDTVIECGVLPKKCFSMGEAEQKRYYVECRLLVRPHEEKPEEEMPEAVAEDTIAEETAPENIESNTEIVSEEKTEE